MARGRRGGRRAAGVQAPAMDPGMGRIHVDGVPERFEDVVRSFQPLVKHPDVLAPQHPFAEMRARWMVDHLLEHEHKALVWVFVVRPGKLDYVRRHVEMRKNPDSAADFTCKFRDPKAKRAIKPQWVWPIRAAAHVHVRRLFAERFVKLQQEASTLLRELGRLEALMERTDEDLSADDGGDEA